MCEARKTQKKKIMMSDLMNAISESEYPQYILYAVEQVQEWMKEMINPETEHSEDADIFSALFQFADDEDELSRLTARLESVKEYADVMPCSEIPNGKPDAVIVSIAPSDYESGLRDAIDYAAVFNRGSCRRVWIISDTFVFDEIAKYIHHVDALSEQGITLRYILVTAWGWVEMPLSGNMAAKHNFMFQAEETRRRRKK